MNPEKFWKVAAAALGVATAHVEEAKAQQTSQLEPTPISSPAGVTEEPRTVTAPIFVPEQPRVGLTAGPTTFQDTGEEVPNRFRSTPESRSNDEFSRQGGFEQEERPMSIGVGPVELTGGDIGKNKIRVEGRIRF